MDGFEQIQYQELRKDAVMLALEAGAVQTLTEFNTLPPAERKLWIAKALAPIAAEDAGAYDNYRRYAKDQQIPWTDELQAAWQIGADRAKAGQIQDN